MSPRSGRVHHQRRGRRGSGARARGFASRLPDLEGADLSTAVTQIVAIDDERVMTMIEIKAERGERTLHNFAAFLAR
jgi:hypothetical protein